LEGLPEHGGICISRSVRDPVRDKLSFTFEDMGEQAVKNIALRIHSYRVRFEGADPPERAAVPVRLSGRKNVVAARWTPPREMATGPSQKIPAEEETDMSKQPGGQFTRRTFIKAAGATGATVYVIWSGPSWFGTHMALAANLTALGTAEAKEMLAMARQLFPHDKLGDEYYWVVVESRGRIGERGAARPSPAAASAQSQLNSANRTTASLQIPRDTIRKVQDTWLPHMN
jgi:class 3 adenylate cyclase